MHGWQGDFIACHRSGVRLRRTSAVHPMSIPTLPARNFPGVLHGRRRLTAFFKGVYNPRSLTPRIFTPTLATHPDLSRAVQRVPDVRLHLPDQLRDIFGIVIVAVVTLDHVAISRAALREVLDWIVSFHLNRNAEHSRQGRASPSLRSGVARIAPVASLSPLSGAPTRVTPDRVGRM